MSKKASASRTNVASAGWAIQPPNLDQEPTKVKNLKIVGALAAKHDPPESKRGESRTVQLCLKSESGREISLAFDADASRTVEEIIQCLESEIKLIPGLSIESRGGDEPCTHSVTTKVLVTDTDFEVLAAALALFLAGMEFWDPFVEVEVPNLDDLEGKVSEYEQIDLVPVIR